MFNFIQRYFWIFSTIASLSAGWYSGYTYYNVKQLKIDLSTSNQQIKSRDDVISKMQDSEKITNDILIKSNTQRQEDKVNYENVYTKLQTITKRLDTSNHINADLVRTIQAGVNGKTVPENANPTSGTNEKTPVFRASSLTRGVIKYGEGCTENTTQLILLQEWIQTQYDRQ